MNAPVAGSNCCHGDDDPHLHHHHHHHHPLLLPLPLLSDNSLATKSEKYRQRPAHTSASRPQTPSDRPWGAPLRNEGNCGPCCRRTCHRHCCCWCCGDGASCYVCGRCSSSSPCRPSRMTPCPPETPPGRNGGASFSSRAMTSPRSFVFSSSPFRSSCPCSSSDWPSLPSPSLPSSH